MKTALLRFVVLVAWFATAAGARAEIATVTEDIRTSFATYHPVAVTATPAARQYAIAPDFSNVSNFGDFSFTEAQKTLLRQNGFVAFNTGFYDMNDLYLECVKDRVPVFVTVDYMLHVLHRQFDTILRRLEKNRFSDTLTTMTTSLLAATIADYNAATREDARLALGCNMAYFGVAAELLGTSPTLATEARTLADAELALINAHAGPSTSPILFGYQDYSQFIVRGHYAGDAQLERYFRAMMWYGTMRFGVNDQLGEAARRRIALQGLLIARMMHGNMDGWNSIYRPTAFLVGEASSTTPPELDRIAAEVYGAGYAGMTPDQLAGDSVRFDAFAARLMAVPGSAINSENGAYFTFLGQRYIPDSFILKQVMTPYRLPRGLDVMAVLGSARAEALLRDTYHELSPAIDDLKTTFSAYPAAAWVQNAYWNWLYCLAPVVQPKGAGYPPFMRTAAWQDKDLAAALGSWAELRHDTILYGEQPTSWGVPPLKSAAQGYVEPNPEAFARLAALFMYLEDGLAGLGLTLDNQTKNANNTIRGALLGLKSIAEKELTGQYISAGEYNSIQWIGKTISDAMLANLPGSDGNMAIIADVATNSTGCQEEAVGHPLDLFVIAEVAGELRVTRGGAYSYYEFPMPISQRMTDQSWRQMLAGSNPPAQPAWLNSYFDPAVPLPATTEVVLFKDYYFYYPMDVKPSPQPVLTGQELTVELKAGWYISQPQYNKNYTFQVQIQPPGQQTTQTLDMIQVSTTPALFRGTADTTSWKGGDCLIEGQAFLNGEFVHRFRTVVPVIKRNGIRPEAWRRFE